MKRIALQINPLRFGDKYRILVAPKENLWHLLRDYLSEPLVKELLSVISNSTHQSIDRIWDPSMIYIKNEEPQK
jgi:hypothetical protein